MCGIAGILNLKLNQVGELENSLRLMNQIQKHRGPDGEGVWMHGRNHAGFAHRRLSIIDLETNVQPMKDDAGNVICFNGEIYNYLELKDELKGYNFKTKSDTEVILASYLKWGSECVSHLRGMFAFAIWDEKKGTLFCTRDRFGIKPFYYAVVNDNFYFASEVKTLLPFLPEIKTNTSALMEYLFFQLLLGGNTLFENVLELRPAHSLTVNNGNISIKKYWEVYYNLDFNLSPEYCEEKIRELISDSVNVHTRSDVPIGSYISGGTDSSVIASEALHTGKRNEMMGFTGKFSEGELYDESRYAKLFAAKYNMPLEEINITSADFTGSIRDIIYSLDYPVAGPGSFPQYHVSKLAAKHRKVVLGGQGGDEIFGGYTRYLIAYFEQCIKGAIDNTLHSGNFIVTYESIIPNLVALQNYKPLLQEFWKDGLFENIDNRYFRLINRAPDMKDEIRWKEFGGNTSPFESFRTIFNGSNVGKESYFDKMTHFDFKTLLPALLHVEDRMSMAHGIESRVPFLDHPLIEFTATIPSNIKFKDGTLKKLLINAMRKNLPEEIVNRKNKMGFPVPLNDWLKKELKEFIFDIFKSRKANERSFYNADAVLKGLESEPKFGRKIWGLLSLEIWMQEFHDKAHSIKKEYLNNV